MLQKISHIRIEIACQYQSGNFSDVFAYFTRQRDAEPALRRSDKHPFYVRFSRGEGLSISSPCAPVVFQFSTDAGRAQRPPSQPPYYRVTGESKKRSGASVTATASLQSTDCIDLAFRLPLYKRLSAGTHSRPRAPATPGWVTFPFTTFAPRLISALSRMAFCHPLSASSWI